MEDARNISDEAAFVLQTYPWRETSLIVDLLTRNYGRMRVVAKGAQRPSSAFRGVLNPFSPLRVSLSGKGEVKTLTSAQWLGYIPLHEKALLSAFYLNEILVKLLPILDAVPTLFDRYFSTLQELARSDAHSNALRYFEVDVLEALGYGLRQLDTQKPWYRFYQGDLVAGEFSDTAQGTEICGKVLEELLSRGLKTVDSERQARIFLRSMLTYYLDGEALNTPKVAVDIRCF